MGGKVHSMEYRKHKDDMCMSVGYRCVYVFVRLCVCVCVLLHMSKINYLSKCIQAIPLASSHPVDLKMFILYLQICFQYDVSIWMVMSCVYLTQT